MKGQLPAFKWVQIAIGVIAGLLVLFVVLTLVINFTSTDCWRKTLAPFDDAFLGIRNLQPPFGSKGSFTVVPYLDDQQKCLKDIFFVRGQYSEYYCSKACEKGINEGVIWDDKLKSSAVESCKEECGKNCKSEAGKERSCIILIPMPTFFQSSIMAFNKPRIYGSGDYKLGWDAKWDTQTINTTSKVACLVFTRSSDGEYKMEVKENAGECK